MSSMNSPHFLIWPIPAWGHIRPFCALATRLVREQKTIIVTFIVSPHVLDKTRTEISRQFLDEHLESSKALHRIRILSPSKFLDDDDLEKTKKLFADAYPAAYQTLYEAKPITCSVTSTTFDAVPAPRAVILNLFYSLRHLQATRAVSGSSVPIITCLAAGAGAIIRFFGPESMGGPGDFRAKSDADVALTRMSEDEIGRKTLPDEKLIRIPGLPVMHDYEFHPQKATFFNKPFDNVMGDTYTSLQECDALIVTTSYAYESLSLDAVKQWFSDMEKELHVLGPLLPSGYGIKIQNGEEGTNVDIETFLGEMLIQHGERSVFFVSFGSLHWPPVPEYVEELIESLIAKKAPFIFSYASPSATFSERLKERIQSSGLGMMTKWSPQHFILNHPATGWFISHGGFNSVTESLASGIPLIFYPLLGDQPVAAAHITENLHAGFELFQVRSGKDLKPLYRNGVTPAGTREAVGIEVRETIDLCRSEKGQEIRNNAEKLKLKFAKAWEEDGAARQEIRNFLQKYA